MPTTGPILTVQTATLSSTTDTDLFSGTGGPFAYDPFFGGFAGIVSSQGIFGEPFHDQLKGVNASDQVLFVIAIQNFANVSAYDIKLRDFMPLGFVIPPDGPDIVVADGAGNVLSWTGNLFDPAGGLTITSPVAPYSQTLGTNVALVTFTLDATVAVPAPLANITNTAQIVGYAASSGGANLIGSNTGTLSDSTPLQTGGILATSVARQPASMLASGQTLSYDITVTLSEGTTRDLRITEAVPVSGAAGFRLVSTQIVQFGANLSASAPIIVQPDGSVLLGTVIDTPDGVQTSADQLVLRVTVANGGTTSGTGTLSTIISAADPNVAGNTWSKTLTNTSALARPDVLPTIAGISAAQNITSTMAALPFAGLILTDPDVGQIQTLTIHPSLPALGSLSGTTPLATNPAGDYVLTGSVDAVQAAARSLVFTPAAGASGTETFGLTLNDGASGIAINSHSTLSITTAAGNPSELAHFPISPQTVLTSTAAGSSTFVQVETYHGPIDNIQTQFLYDGSAPLAIVAGQSAMLISSRATATAVQLQGGTNVLDMRQGSSFLVSGTGTDTFLFHADQPQETWNTIVNFHRGDNVTLYGFQAGVSSLYWDANAGAAGYTGLTLRTDINNDGNLDSSITFAGKSLSDQSHFVLQTGSVGGSNFLTITT